MRAAYNSVLAFLALVVAGCAGTGVAPGEMAPFIQSQKDHARQLQQDGKLAQALVVWRSTLPAGGPDTETRNAIKTLETRIDAEAAALRKQAKAAYDRGNATQGDRYALKSLALKPGNADALSWLTASKSAKAQAQARDKAGQAYANAPAAKPGSDSGSENPAEVPGNAEAGQLAALYAAKDYEAVVALAAETTIAPESRDATMVRSAHVALGDQRAAVGNALAAISSFRKAIEAKPQRDDPLVTRIRSLQKDASDEWYRKGRKALNTDIDAAIAAFSTALEVKPDHAAAKSALKRAQTLKRNLERIENR